MNRILRISILVVICLILIFGIALLIGRCSDKKNGETTPTPPITQPSTQPSTQPTTPPDPECSEHIDADTNYICDVCGDELERPTTPEEVFVETNDKIYVIAEMLNLRKTPDETGVATVAVITDTELERFGYYTAGNSAGMSKVSYEGEIYYVATKYVTTQKPITEFTETDETVYFIQNTYAYTRPSYLTSENYSKHIDTFYEGESVKRTGIATLPYVDQDGSYVFARIEYTVSNDGEPETRVSYVNNAYLTTEVPATPNPDGDIVFVEDNSFLKVIAYESIALRSSTSWINGDTEHNNAQIAGYALNGQILQATHKGVEESDQTVWYKVVVEGETYYVIFRADLLEVQTTSSNTAVQTIFNEYSISLPAGLTLSPADESVYVGTSDTIAVTVINSGELPAGSLTPETFLQLLVAEMELTGVQVQQKNGIYYFEAEYEYEVSGVSGTEYYLGVVHEGNNNNFYFTCLIAETDIIETLWGYANTITINPEA